MKMSVYIIWIMITIANMQKNQKILFVWRDMKSRNLQIVHCANRAKNGQKMQKLNMSRIIFLEDNSFNLPMPIIISCIFIETKKDHSRITWTGTLIHPLEGQCAYPTPWFVGLSQTISLIYKNFRCFLADFKKTSYFCSKINKYMIWQQ